VIDDLESVSPWLPRGIKIHGSADLATRRGYVGAETSIRVKPEPKWSWDIEEPAMDDALLPEMLDEPAHTREDLAGAIP
jgi:hypothetical protein